MPVLECLIAFFFAVQTATDQTTPARNSPAEGYLILGLVAAILGFVVLIIMKTSARRARR
jgi:threonine/homoserine/homoserine lactone efflux protein